MRYLKDKNLKWALIRYIIYSSLLKFSICSLFNCFVNNINKIKIIIQFDNKKWDTLVITLGIGNSRFTVPKYKSIKDMRACPDNVHHTLDTWTCFNRHTLLAIMIPQKISNMLWWASEMMKWRSLEKKLSMRWMQMHFGVVIEVSSNPDQKIANFKTSFIFITYRFITVRWHGE